MSMGQTKNRYEGVEGFVGMLSPSLDSIIHYSWNFGFANKKLNLRSHKNHKENVRKFLSLTVTDIININKT